MLTRHNLELICVPALLASTSMCLFNHDCNTMLTLDRKEPFSGLNFSSLDVEGLVEGVYFFRPIIRVNLVWLDTWLTVLFLNQFGMHTVNRFVWASFLLPPDQCPVLPWLVLCHNLAVPTLFPYLNLILREIWFQSNAENTPSQLVKLLRALHSTESSSIEGWTIVWSEHWGWDDIACWNATACVLHCFWLLIKTIYQYWSTGFTLAAV